MLFVGAVTDYDWEVAIPLVRRLCGWFLFGRAGKHGFARVTSEADSPCDAKVLLFGVGIADPAFAGFVQDPLVGVWESFLRL